MYRPIVETDTGENLFSTDPSGTLSGKGVMSLLMGMLAYCKKGKAKFAYHEIYDHLQELSNGKLCSLFDPLMDCIYREENATKEEIESPTYKYTDINSISDSLKKIVLLLEEANRFPDDDNPWFHQDETLSDFRDLSYVIKFFRQRHAQKIRIVMA